MGIALAEQSSEGAGGTSRRDRWRSDIDDWESEPKASGQPSKRKWSAREEKVEEEKVESPSPKPRRETAAKKRPEPEDDEKYIRASTKSPDEDEEVAPRSKKGPKKGGKAKGPLTNKQMIIAVVIVALLVVSIAAYFLFIRGGSPKEEDPVAKISFPDTPASDAKAGTPVNIDGSGSDGKGSDIMKYDWDFGDGSTGSGALVQHVYLEEGSYVVTLTVTTSVGTGKATATVTVSGFAVTVPLNKVGDKISYDISGYIEVSNPSGFWTTTYTKKAAGGLLTVKMTAKVTLAHLNIDTAKDPRMEVVTSQGQAEDGFDQTHSCFIRDTDQVLPVTGWAAVKLITETGDSTMENMTITGDGTAAEMIYTDLNTNRTIKSTRTDSYSLSVGAGGQDSFQKSGEDVMVAYPKEREEFNVDALRSDRTFNLEDTGQHTFGSNTFLWSVVAPDNINGQPCLKMHVSMDEDSMSESHLTYFGMDVWISSAFSMPIKAHMHTEGLQDGNRVVMDYTSIYTTYTPGDTVVAYGSCGASTPDGHFYKACPDVDFGAPDVYGPSMGPDPVSLASYPLQDAVDLAKAESEGLSDFLDDNPAAFLVDSYYNESSGEPTWNLTFGTKDSASAYSTIVSKTAVLREGPISVSEVGRSITEFTTALTFTGAEEVFKSRDDIVAAAYTGGKVDLERFSLGCKADMPYPRPEVPVDLNIISVTSEYLFYIKASDGSFSAGVDAQTGQMFFIKTHTGT